MEPDRVYFTDDGRWVFCASSPNNLVMLGSHGSEFKASNDPIMWGYTHSISTDELREILRLLVKLDLARGEK